MKLILRRTVPLVFALLFLAPDVWACSCVQPMTPQVEFAETDTVFSGEVTDIVDKQTYAGGILFTIRSWLGLHPEFDEKYYGNRVTFRVMRSWKGVTSTVVTLSTAYGGGDCGYAFTPGAEYVVYASGETDSLSTSICSRTSLLSRATEDMTYLARLPELPLTAVSALSSGRSLALVAVLVMVVILLEIRRMRRRRPPL
jgi:hypothetical protein